jgi:2-oxoisovalerate dehydrogenase E1 component
MPYFRNTDHFYKVMRTFFERVQQEEEVVEALVEADLIIRFKYRDPEGTITIDLTRKPIAVHFGPTDIAADVEMTSSADISHLFWLGKLNVPRAIATRKIVARGSVPKALKLLPAIKPAFDIYLQVLRELGYGELIPKERRESRVERKRGLLERLRALISRAPKLEIDYAALNRHFIPIVEELPPEEIEFVEQALPTKEKELKVEMLRRMVLIRVFEEALAREFAQGNVPSEILHLSIGQEACAVGACFALRGWDYMTTTHRGHGHMLAKGADIKRMMAEIFGKSTGLCRGKGGTMHVTDARVGALGANGIVGASILVATGAALSAKMRKSGQVALAFFGDGATNQGMFHEAMNFASLFDLPAVFVIENNLYGEFTPLERSTRVKRLSDRAAAYAMPGVTVDGNDVWAVYGAVREAVERARRDEGPTLIECLTYRWRGHTEGESARYRSEEEVEGWKAKCPIKRFKARLLSEGIITEADFEEMEREAKQAIEEALAFAKGSPDPELTAVTEDIFSPEPAYLYREGVKPSGKMREITYSQAIREALAEEMRRDGRVFILGEDVTTGGYFAVTVGLVEEFGPERVIDTPISEYAIVGSAVGAAMTGMRPVVEIMLSDFLTCCMDPIINQAAKLRYMSGGQYSLPLVVRSPGGTGFSLAAQHSQTFDALLTGIPGLIVIAPGTPYDAKGLLKAAIRSNNPVLFFENKLLYLATGQVPEGEYVIPIGVAEVKREGSDVTLVAIGSRVIPALEAAEELAREGIEVEVVDPRTLVPLDAATIVRSAVKTGRLVVVEEAPLTHGFGVEIATRVAEVAPGTIIRRVAALDTPIPYSRSLEAAVVPDVEKIKEAVKEVLGSVFCLLGEGILYSSKARRNR